MGCELPLSEFRDSSELFEEAERSVEKQRERFQNDIVKKLF